MAVTHGGRRENSGRTKRLTKKSAVTIRLEPEQAESFRRICESKGVSQSAMIAHWISKNAIPITAKDGGRVG